MTVINQAGSVSRSPLVTTFFVKNHDVFMCEAGWHSFRDLCLRLLCDQDENFPMLTLQPVGPGWNFNGKIASLLQHFKGIPITSISLSLKSPQSYDSCEWYSFMFHHFVFVSWIPFWSTGLKFFIWTENKFVSVTEPTWLLSSYEEDLSLRVNLKHEDSENDLSFKWVLLEEQAKRLYE